MEIIPTGAESYLALHDDVERLLNAMRRNVQQATKQRRKAQNPVDEAYHAGRELAYGVAHAHIAALFSDK